MAKKAWRLIFAEGLLWQHLAQGPDGGLDFRRSLPGSNDFTPGQIIEGHYQEGIMLLNEIVASTEKRFGDITKEERNAWARLTHAEISHEEMMEIMKGHYPLNPPTDDDLVRIIHRRFPLINGRTIAGSLV